MTATAVTPRANSSIWIALLVLAGGIVLLAFVGRDDASLGFPADPRGTGREGLAALRLMVERTGGDVSLDAHVPDSSHDVAVLAVPDYTFAAAFLAGDDDVAGDVVFGPILDWVENGGVLVTGVDVPGGPEPAFAQNDEDDVQRGTCTIAEYDGIDSVSMGEYAPLQVGADDTSCFGDGDRAVVVSRSLGSGRIVRIAQFQPIFNRRLDEADNGALAARTLDLGAQPSVVFLAGPDPSSIGVGGPVDDEGNPIGSGESTLFDLIPDRVFALLAGLAGAVLLYAYAVGRRLGSPVAEPLPIELPSSSYTEAVGRLYGRAEQPRERTANLLRHDFRTSAARRVGLAPAATADDLASALELTAGADRASLVGLLDGPPPVSDAELVSLATHLATQRNRLRRGGSSVPERTPDDPTTT